MEKEDPREAPLEHRGDMTGSSAVEQANLALTETRGHDGLSGPQETDEMGLSTNNDKKISAT